jgi:hypothetical protein
MMIQFFYKKKSGGSGQYTVLVADPNRTNDHATEPQLHGFVIGELSDKELIEFFSSFETSIEISPDDKRVPIVKELNTDEAYNKFVSSRYVSDRSYRTFNISGISQVRQILVGSVD